MNSNRSSPETGQVSAAPPLIGPYRGVWPNIAPDAFVAPGAVVMGDIEIGAQASIWFNVVLRGDVNKMRIGARTNVQDGSVIHVTRKTHPTRIGADITIGHQAMLHGCILEDGCFIGMRSVVLDGAVVESGAMVAAGALITPGRRVRGGELWAGNPAKLLRAVSEEERKFFGESVQVYIDLAREYREILGL